MRLLPAVACALLAAALPAAAADERPNILFCIADDWGWPHAGAYGDPVVKTPAFDRIAKEGVLFDHACVASPSCTPSRNTILTGQMFYRLEEGANLWSTLQTKYPVYPLLLEKAGYAIGHWRKSWGPGSLKAGGYIDHHPAGPVFKGFDDFLAKRPAGKPFCFWLGAGDPHRPYDPGSGAKSGMDLAKIPVPGFWPDDPAVRSDIADYYFEVQRFDADLGAALKRLEELGDLENTLIVVTGDNGTPFPRCKANLYDMGFRQPLAVRWGKRVKPGRRVTDFVSFADYAPTFLEAAGVAVPAGMTGRSLMNVLTSDASGRVDPARDFAVVGRERHVPAQRAPSVEAYPARAIRTDGWLYVRNLRPDLWPAGVHAADNTRGAKEGCADCDDGPTKRLILGQPEGRPYALCFARRPEEELYDCAKDPFQLVNLAADPAHAETKTALRTRLDAFLKRTEDPRATGKPHVFDTLPYPMRDTGKER
jgi:arylsulfatase A-like enzyme